jgi:hypothetical protein
MNDSENNPFQAPTPVPGAREPSHEMSIEHEPHLVHDHFEADPSERTAGIGRDPLGAPSTIDDDVEHGIWDEPALTAQFSRGLPEGAISYPMWLAAGQRETTRSKSALICLLVVLFAGPWAILGTLIAQFGAGTGMAGSLVMICLIGPLVEEVLTASGLLWIVEKRPYLFLQRRQILWCAVSSGLWFAVIENYLYLNVYIAKPSMDITLWRWTVCVLLHVGCTFVSGMGLARVWQRTMAEGSKPQMSLASPFIVAAVICHAFYNISMVVIELIRGGL